VAIVTLTDVEGELPGMTLSSSSQPTDTQVQGYLNNVTAEVESLVASLGVPWPADGTTVATFLKTTILDGVIARALSAMYRLSAPEHTPSSVREMTQRYADDLRKLPDVVRGISGASPATEGRIRPLVAVVPRSPHNWQDLEDFTRRRDPTVWPWRGRGARPFGPGYGWWP
jgi:hypothetical protein